MALEVISSESVIAQYKKQVQEKYRIVTDELDWQSYSSGERIYEQGYPLPFLSFLVKGKVKIYMTSAEGKRLIVTFNRPLELFGEIGFILKIETIHTIEAVTPVHIGILPVEMATSWRNKEAFNEVLLQSMSRKFLTKSTTLSFHLLHEADVKLASYLASISHDEYGDFITSSVPKNELRSIAEFIGITVRHQNRCIQLFEQAGILKRIPGFIVIMDSKKLLQHAKQNIYEMQ